MLSPPSVGFVADAVVVEVTEELDEEDRGLGEGAVVCVGLEDICD
jgi:hypothetical protein